MSQNHCIQRKQGTSFIYNLLIKKKSFIYNSMQKYLILNRAFTEEKKNHQHQKDYKFEMATFREKFKLNSYHPLQLTAVFKWPHVHSFTCQSE
jgi:hypothetical protein